MLALRRSGGLAKNLATGHNQFNMRLSDRYEELSAERRAALAKAVGVSDGYLWQLARGWRRPARGGKRVQPSIELMGKLVAADAALTLSDLVSEFAESSHERAV